MRPLSAVRLNKHQAIEHAFNSRPGIVHINSEMLPSVYYLLSGFAILSATFALPAPKVADDSNPLAVPDVDSLKPIDGLPDHFLRWTPKQPLQTLPKAQTLRLLFGFQRDLSKRKGDCDELIPQHNAAAFVYVEPNEHYSGSLLKLTQVSLALYTLFESLSGGDQPVAVGNFEVVNGRHQQVIKGGLGSMEGGVQIPGARDVFVARA